MRACAGMRESWGGGVAECLHTHAHAHALLWWPSLLTSQMHSCGGLASPTLTSHPYPLPPLQALRGKPGYRTLGVQSGAVLFVSDAFQRVRTRAAHLEGEYKALQAGVAAKAIAAAATYAPVLREAAAAVAELSAARAVADVACNGPSPWVMPEVAAGTDLLLTAIRHPWLERQGGPFLPSDVALRQSPRGGGDPTLECEGEGEGRSLLRLITGPNMGGKSTLLRSAALAVCLAHMGCPVPCAAARVPLRTAVLARVGSADCMVRSPGMCGGKFGVLGWGGWPPNLLTYTPRPAARGLLVHGGDDGDCVRCRAGGRRVVCDHRRARAGDVDRCASAAFSAHAPNIQILPSTHVRVPRGRVRHRVGGR